MLARTRALLLIAPLIVFLVFTYFIPLANMFTRGLYDPLVNNILPDTHALLQQWEGVKVPDQQIFKTLAHELLQAREQRTLGKVARSTNRIRSGMRNLLTKTARSLARVSETTQDWRAAMIDIDGRWNEVPTWHIMRRAGERITFRYYLNALDLTQNDANEIVRQPENKRIYVALIGRTLMVSLAVTLICLLFGYPLAYWIAHSEGNRANLLLLLVLTPFWISLLVRTTSWIVLLQQHGVINSLLIAVGLIDEDGRLSMIYNMTGTLVAMTHVLLPFMILPLYSVMRSISPLYMRAASSLGGGFWYSFRRVYWPQSLPGVGAGTLLVFILAIGYYITPALVGGQSGQLISNQIAYHIQQSLNWGLAAALGSILLIGVKLLYLVYDRIAGMDRVKLN